MLPKLFLTTTKISADTQHQRENVEKDVNAEISITDKNELHNIIMEENNDNPEAYKEVHKLLNQKREREYDAENTIENLIEKKKKLLILIEENEGEVKALRNDIKISQDVIQEAEKEIKEAKKEIKEKEQKIKGKVQEIKVKDQEIKGKEKKINKIKEDLKLLEKEEKEKNQNVFFKESEKGSSGRKFVEIKKKK